MIYLKILTVFLKLGWNIKDSLNKNAVSSFWLSIEKNEILNPNAILFLLR